MTTPLPAHASAHLTAAELLLLRPVIETLAPAPYAPLARKPSLHITYSKGEASVEYSCGIPFCEPLTAGGVPAATNLTPYIHHTREEIQEMLGRRGHPAAGDVPFGGDDPDLEFDVPSDSTNIRNAISKYVRMVCLHINTERALTLPGINSHCALIPGGFWDPARGAFAASPSHANWDATGISPVTAVEFYTRLATTIPTHNITPLMIHGFATLGTKNLANQTTYIFIPVTDLRYGRRIPHHTLIVYFPIIKTIDWLDSRHGDMGPHNYHFAALFAGIVLPEMGLVGQVLNFVSQFLGPTTKNNREFNPCDWRMRFDGSDRQNDTEPSGLPWPANEAESAAMVCTNALCIVAGYNLDYLPKYNLVDQAVWMSEHRGRVAMELHQGRRPLPPAVGPPSCPLNYPIESPLNILAYRSDDDNFQFLTLSHHLNDRNSVVHGSPAGIEHDGIEAANIGTIPLFWITTL